MKAVINAGGRAAEAVAVWRLVDPGKGTEGPGFGLAANEMSEDRPATSGGLGLGLVE